MPTITPAKVSAHHIEQFERHINLAKQALANLPGDDYYNLLWKIIHQPGWTTPAEALFFEAALENVQVQAQHLAQAHQQLLKAAQAVGNN